MSLISPIQKVISQPSNMMSEDDSKSNPRFCSDILSSGKKSLTASKFRAGLKNQDYSSLEDENIQSMKMLSEFLQTSQTPKTPIRDFFSVANEKTNVEPEVNIQNSSQQARTKECFRSNKKMPSSIKLNPNVPSFVTKSTTKNTESNAQIQGISGHTSPAQNDLNTRHLCGVSPTRYRQHHISSINLHKLFKSDEIEEEPMVRCFQDIADEASVQKDFKEIIQAQDDLYQPTTKVLSSYDIAAHDKLQLPAEETVKGHAEQKSSGQFSERCSVSAISISSLTSSQATIPSRISALEGIIHSANNMIGHLECQLNLKNMKIDRLKEAIITKDQQTQHYRAEREKTLLLENALKCETLKLNENTMNLNKKLLDKQNKLEGYLIFMTKIQDMNNKLLTRIKASEKQCQIVTSKEKVIKRLEGLEQKLLQAKENKLFDVNSCGSSVPQTDRSQSGSVLQEVNKHLNKTETNSENFSQEQEAQTELSQHDYKLIMSELVNRYQRDPNVSSQA